MPRYQCVQFGICQRADANEEFEIKPGETCQCPRNDPHCQGQLIVLEKPKKRWPLYVGPGVIAAALVGLGLWHEMKPVPKPTPEQLLIEVWPWLKH